MSLKMIRRPKSAASFSDVQVDNPFSSPSLEKQLEDLKSSGYIGDNCLVASERKHHKVSIPRPKTAMAYIETQAAGDFPVSSPINIADPYLTSYKQHYPWSGQSHTGAHRPGSTKKSYQGQYSLGGPVGNTHYDDTYYAKEQTRELPYRTATASGNRVNKPHPFQTFMIWRYPRDAKPEQPYSEWASKMTNEIMDKMCRGQMATIYQSDYLGMPQGCDMRGVFGETVDWKSKVPRTNNTFTRHTYKQPPQLPTSLVEAKTRFGSNKTHSQASVGVVPSANKRKKGVNTETSYEVHFQDPDVSTVMRRAYSPKPPPNPFDHRQVPGPNPRNQIENLMADLAIIPDPIAPCDIEPPRDAVPMDIKVTTDARTQDPGYVPVPPVVSRRRSAGGRSTSSRMSRLSTPTSKNSAFSLVHVPKPTCISASPFQSHRTFSAY